MSEPFDYTYFTPDQDVKSVVDAFPTKVTKSLDCELYAFTDHDFANNLLDAARRGVVVRIMNEESEAATPKNKALLQFIVNTAHQEKLQIQVKIVKSVKDNLDHLKMVVLDAADGVPIDTSSVGLGSYNLSDNAEKQDNSYRWTNNPDLVKEASAKFNEDWQVNRQDAAWQVQPS